MKYYFAPLEGVTGYIYRNAHHAYFKDVDKYFTPFIVPTRNKILAPKELRDVLPEHNEGITLIPQILTNRAEDFLRTAGELKHLGYHEINLNLGCPSRTVVSKNRGSGFLAKQEELDRFLDEIFTKSDRKISVKTRIGKTDPDEFYELIEIFNKYPMEELIIHPRLQSDYYKNKPNMTVFKDAVRLSKNPLCYNGDIFTAKEYESFILEFPQVDRVMLGRGLIANPGLTSELAGYTMSRSACPEGRHYGVPEGYTYLDKGTFEAFHDMVLSGYRETISGDRNVLFKMKELWLYMGCIFADSGKYVKKIKKAERMNDYLETVSALLRDREIAVGAGYVTE